jgi:hypothetical protein
MSSLVPRRSQPVQAVEPDWPAQPDRLLAMQVAEAERPGIVAAARIQAGAFAASVAMQNAIMLSRTTDAAFRTSPMGEDVYRSIFAAFGNFATNEIHRLNIHDGGQF